MPSPPAAPTAAAPHEDLPDTVLLVQFYMDNCSGTNKSQFKFGVMAGG